MKDTREFRLTLAGIVMHAVGTEVLLVLPAFVHGLIEHLGFGDAAGGRIAAAENGGMAVATVAMTFLWSRIHWRNACVMGLLMMAAGNVLSIWAHGLVLMMISRFASGIGAGALIVLSYALVGISARKERNFGILMVSGLLYGALVFAIIPFGLRTWGITSVLLLFAGLPIVALPLAGYFPDMREKRRLARPPAELSAALKASALLGMATYALAIGAMWTYMFRIGAAAGISESTLSRSFALSQLCAIAGGLLASLVGRRLKLAPALSLGVAALVIAIIGLFDVPSALRFTLVVCAFNMAWNFFHPCVLAAFAQFEADSRMLIYASPLLMIGITVGPAVASMTVGDHDFSTTIAASAILLVGSWALLLLPTLKGPRTLCVERRQELLPDR